MDYLHHLNTKRWSKDGEIEARSCIQNLSDWSHTINEIHQWPEYQPQPLRTLPNTATQLGVGALFVKDESERFGPELGSFKALGAPYAVYRILADKVYSDTGTRPSSTELRSKKFHEITKNVTVSVATDGNQGRGLAYGAKIFGCRCVVYIHNHVSAGRAQRMMDLGATVIRISSGYEDSVERAKEDCRMNGWHFVSSTSWDDFDGGIPRDVMNAYMVVVEEAMDMVPSLQEISHVFVCGGVGSIAAAIFLGILVRFREMEKSNPVKQISLPRFVVVEPQEADCLFQSARNGEISLAKGNLHTMMAGLACRRPSPAAWKVLSWVVSDFITVPDSCAVHGMKALASGHHGDIPIVSGESSAASMGIMLEACKEQALRGDLGLDSTSQVLLFSLEGATDPEIYEQIVGMQPQAVFQAQANFSVA
ncbi:tryptophan synthase beta subunit-like PLP-dependent enzyme [Xylaria sp. FL1042]|nr:tryptophan synthase beta subunit-like PLP-dependent enzyme [Xylaria sp. FL1042]